MTKILKPLEQFYCDKCGDVIKQPDHGWLEWRHGVFSKHTDAQWRILHHSNSGKSCIPVKAPSGAKSYHLHHALEFAPALVFSMIAIDPAEFDIFARRLLLPYYEQARFYIQQANSDGFFSRLNPRCYSKESLIEIIERYAEDYSEAA
jgi:hypothetical protein